MQFLDPEQTHDRLFAQKIKPAILSLLTNAISTKGIFDHTMPIALIERDAPGALKPWADDWSGKMFEFLKKLSLTHILDDGFLNGSAYGFEPQYTANLPELIDLEEYHGDLLTVRIPSGSVGVLTWLERTHDEQSAPYCDKLTNKLTIAMRRSRLFKNTAAEALEIELSTRNWLHNSVCFQGIELVGLTGNQADFLLYDNMQDFLDNLWGLLDISPCKLLTGFTVKHSKTFSVLQKNRDFPFSVISSGYFVDQLADQSLDYILPLFSSVPGHYHNAYLFKGEIQTGDVTTVYNAGANSLSVVIKSEEFNYLKYFDSLISPPLRGFELNQLPFENKNYSEINASIPGNTTNLSVNFATTKNNHDIPNKTAGAADWRLWTTFPPLTANQSQAPFLGKVGANFFNMAFYSEDTNIAYRSLNGSSNFLTIENIGDSLIGWEGSSPFAPGRRGSFLLQKVTGGGGGEITTERLQFKKDFFSVSFFNSPSLFSDFEVLILNSDLAIRADQSLTISEEGGVSNTTWHYVTRTEVAQKTAIKIVVNHGGDMMQIPNISWAVVENSAESNFASTDTGDTAIAYSQAPMTTIPVLIEQSSPIRRSPRVSPPNYPDLVVVDSSQAEPITFYYGAPAENRLNEILYPDGPDGPPLLDPDTDNGDIMPDSLRIKEIHAALEADKYGVHPQDSQETPKKRLNNLGRLIEAASYVLGVNFNEDGLNRPYPEPVLFDPEKIEEINSKKLLKNAQFAVAEMGGNFDASSLYEVRSPIAKAGKNGTEIDQRPHAIKYHNIQQLMDAVADDNAKLMGGGKNAVFQVPNATGDDFQQYEGLYQAIADCLYMSANNSKAINELQNQAIKCVWMLGQILKAVGVPCRVEKVDGVSGLYDANGTEIPGYLPVPALDPKSPTLVGLLGIVLMNLQQVVGGGIGFKTDEVETSAADCEVAIKASPLLIDASAGGTVKFTVSRKVKKPEHKEQLVYVNLVVNSTLGKSAFDGIFKPGLWTIDLQPGELSKDFSIKVEKNTTYNENHSITAILSGGDGYVLGVNKSAVVAILNGNKEDDKEDATELDESDWKLSFTPPEPKPDFVPNPEE